MRQLAKKALGLAPVLFGVFAALAAVAIIGVFMAAPFILRRAPVPVGAYEVGTLTAAPELKVLPDLTYLLTISFTDRNGTPSDAQELSATISMIGMGSSPQPLTKVSPGLYRGSGSFPMAGRWTFRVSAAGGSFDIPATTAGWM
jgi:hypothetical protein